MAQIDEMLAAVAAASERNENIWDMAIAVGMEARSNEDSARFALGEIACRVQKQYGRNTIGRFAKEINKRVAVVKEYRRLVRFYGGTKAACAAILDEFKNLSYSHLREAMRFDDPGKAYSFLKECSTEGWTIEQSQVEIADRLGKPRPPLKLIDVEVPIAHLRATQVTFELDPASINELGPQYLRKRRVRLAVYEVQEQEN